MKPRSPLLLLLLLVPLCASFKILVYNSKFGHSHSTFLGNIADILVEAGHNVSSLIPDIYPPFADGTHKSHIIRVPGDPWAVEFWEKTVMGDFSFIFRDDGWDSSKMIGQTPLLRESFAAQCNFTVNYGSLMEGLAREKFDLVIAENFDFCGVGISHVIGAKSLVTVSTTNLFDHQALQIGQPSFLAHVPPSWGRLLHGSSILDRLYNLFEYWKSLWMWNEMEGKTERVFKRVYGDEFPSLSEITSNAVFVLTNSDPFIDFARPTLRKVVELGGIGVREPKKLTEEWESLLALRPRTVVVSFGTVARAFLMPDNMKASLVEAFSRFPDTTFVWKYEKPEETFASHAANVVLTEWMPQNDLLNDPRVAGFLSHGGKGSVVEAATRGKPAVFIPLFGDQIRNAATAEHLGFDDIATALREMLESEEVHRRAKEMKETVEARPFSPRELLLRHVEFAARMGPQKALQPQARGEEGDEGMERIQGLNLSFIVYNNIDLLLGLLFILAVLLYLLLSLLFSLLRRLLRVQPKSKKE